MSSPTQLSLALLRRSGYLAEVTEHYVNIPDADDPMRIVDKFKRDLFHCVDILAIKKGTTLAVQTTTSANVAARMNKIRCLMEFDWIKLAGWRLEVHGWEMSGGRWGVRVVDMSTELTDYNTILRAGRHGAKRLRTQQPLF